MDNLCIEPIQVPVKLEGVAHDSPFQCTITVQPHQTSNEVNHINNIEYLGLTKHHNCIAMQKVGLEKYC